MFPSTAIKEGALYVRAKEGGAAGGGDGSSGGGGFVWKQRHVVITKEQFCLYEGAESMRKVDQWHLITPCVPEGSTDPITGKVC
jgi:hypothetical protein